MANITNIYLMGSGIYSVLHFTVETIQALKASDVCFVLHDDLYIHEYVAQYCADVRDLINLYDNGKIRADIYREISELIMKEAENKVVSFLVHGHPLFLVSAAEYTIERAREKNLNLTILSAVSSFDSILTELQVDFGYGLQLYDSTTLLSNNWQINTKLPTLIFQLATLLNSKVVYDEPDVRTLEPLVTYLCQFYPPTHQCTIVHCSTTILEKATKITMPLSEIQNNESIELWKRPTLYIPVIT